MGSAKDFMAEQESLSRWARGFLREMKVLHGCEFHPGNYRRGPTPIEDAYPRFNYLVTSGNIVLEKNETRRNRTDALKKAYDENSGLVLVGCCPECEAYFGGD